MVSPGPVFAYEARRAARRWQVYAARVVLVSGLLLALSLAWASQAQGTLDSARLAHLGRVFHDVLLSVLLVLTMLVAPAAAAGSLCQDKAQGNLTHLFATDLRDSEIVLGKVGARSGAMLSLLAASAPLLALMTLLGGIDPVWLTLGMAIIAAVAVLGVSLTTLFSAWATRPYEALLATYAVWAVWLLTPFTIDEMFRGVPRWMTDIHPFYLIFDRSSGGRGSMANGLIFVTGALVLSGLLMLATYATLRGVVLRSAGRGARPRRRRRAESPRVQKLLDSDPILWRELHRRAPSVWVRVLWALYFGLSLLAALGAVLTNSRVEHGVTGFVFSLGLLIVSTMAATGLAEERVRGSLDVLMTAPVSTRSLVWAKWRGMYRLVPPLAVLPMAIVVVTALRQRSDFDRVFWVSLEMGGLVLGYGAVVVSLGLLMAVWQKRLGRAVATTVALYLTATVIWPAVALMMNLEPAFFDLGPDSLWFSPFFVGYEIVEWASGRRWVATEHWGAIKVVIVAWAVAVGLFGLALVSFDRCLGRVREYVRWRD